MSLKEEIREILYEHAGNMTYDDCGYCENDSEEIDKVVELILEVVNDRPLMEPLK